MTNIQWNLNSIYSSDDFTSYRADKEELVSRSQELTKLLESAEDYPAENWLPRAVGILDRLQDLSENLESFAYAVWSTKTADEAAQAEIDDLEARSLAAKDAAVQFRALLSKFPDAVNLLDTDAELPSFRYWIEEQRRLAVHQMSPKEESLAADLQRCGGDFWDRLHDKMVSGITAPWDDEEKTLSQLRAMAYDADRNKRRRAWQEETALLKKNEVPLAAALNGVKGTTVILNKRRGWGSTLEKSLVQNRLSRTALDAMLGVMNESLPLFRTYFRAKAEKLGLEQLSWYDILAPMPAEGNQRWSWEAAADFIAARFDTLSPEMGDFARSAFDRKWIDATPRNGKVDGAYCIHLPLAAESRILCNFDGSFNAVFTVAHELGHAWHGHVMKDLSALNRQYPMTLAETASIFAETLVFRSALENADAGSQPAILDTYLIGASQVIVDILSRFHFESALLRRRPSGELSPRELTEIMLDAQKRTYGDALNPEELHGWMWAVKSHYYSPDLAYYNFPYAFGLLFALGLYSCFQEDGAAFAGRYTELLRLTGSDDAAGVARAAGIDIESPDFWRRGIAAVEDLVTRFKDSGES